MCIFKKLVNFNIGRFDFLWKSQLIIFFCYNANKGGELSQNLLEKFLEKSGKVKKCR